MSYKLSTAVLALGFLGFSQSAVMADPVTMVIQADTVLSGPCVLSSQFKHEDKIVFRAKVIDTATGEQFGADSLESLVVKLSDGTELTGDFEPHPPKDSTDDYWTATWVVPADYPTGSFGYTVTATGKNGDIATFVPFNNPHSQLTVVAQQ